MFLALDDSQNLNQTGIQSFCIIERNSKAILGAGASSNKDSKKVTNSAKKDMAEPTMPSQGKAQDKEYFSQKSSESQETKKCCFCIPIGSKTTPPERNETHISMQVDTEQSKALKRKLLND